MSVAVSKTQHEQHQVTVLDGLSVRYIDVGAGTGKPPLLLLHGLASRIEEYEALITPLAVKNRVIVLDLPGNGYTDKPDRRYTLAYCEDAALAILDHLKITRANVAGGSLGGNLTLARGSRIAFGRASCGSCRAVSSSGRFCVSNLASGIGAIGKVASRRSIPRSRIFTRSTARASCACTTTSASSRSRRRSIRSRRRSHSRRFSCGATKTTGSTWELESSA